MIAETKGKQRRPTDRPGVSCALLWVLTIGIALVSMRFCLTSLANAGIVAEEDGNLMLAIAFPVALLTIGKPGAWHGLSQMSVIFLVARRNIIRLFDSFALAKVGFVPQRGFLP